MPFLYTCPPVQGIRSQSFRNDLGSSSNNVIIIIMMIIIVIIIIIIINHQKADINGLYVKKREDWYKSKRHIKKK
jgi:hypothetical protein